MGFLNGLAKRAADLAANNPDKVSQGINKASRLIDQRTGRKHADKIDKVAGRLHDAVDRAAKDRKPPRPPRPAPDDRP